MHAEPCFCAGMGAFLDAQVAADTKGSEVPDSMLLHAHAELAKPCMGPLSIVCASSPATSVSLLAFGDFLLAELQVQSPTKAAALVCDILHVRSDPHSSGNITFMVALMHSRDVSSVANVSQEAHKCPCRPGGVDRRLQVSVSGNTAPRYR